MNQKIPKLINKTKIKFLKNISKFLNLKNEINFKKIKISETKIICPISTPILKPAKP